MKCPRQGCWGDTEVLRVERSRAGFTNTRRRRCLICGTRFTTDERLRARSIVDGPGKLLVEAEVAEAAE
jgi:transcriptional regulator NrdR family protein